VVTQKRNGAVLPGEVDDFATIGAAVDQVANEDQTVVLGESEPFEQLGELLMTPVDVADGDDSTVHSCKCANLLASPLRGSKQESLWI
jgi:hypothetical protein